MNATVTNHADQTAFGQAKMRRRLLDSLPTKARTTGEAAAARSRFVRRLRIALPILAVILVAAFIVNTRSNNVDQAFLDDFEDLSATADELRVAGPKFTGVDNNGKPYEITARSAMQRPGARDLVELDSPRALQGGLGEQTIVSADKGLYRSDANILELEENVSLEHKIGAETYVLSAPAAKVAIKDELVVSDSGVTGKGPNDSELRADHMIAYRAEGRVVFNGNFSLRLNPRSGSSKGAEENDTPEPAEKETNEAQ